MKYILDASIAILVLVLAAAIGFNAYKIYNLPHGVYDTMETSNDDLFYEDMPTVEAAVAAWGVDKEHHDLEELCFDLPESVVSNIIERIGTYATYQEIATEYLRNTEYYISAQIKEAIPELPGPDIENSNVEIKTTIQRPKPELSKPTIEVKDTVHALLDSIQ